MKFIKAFIVVLLMATSALAVGYYAPYGYRYVPQLTTQGTTDYAQIVASEVATDSWMNGIVTNDAIVTAKLAKFKTLGDVGYTTLSAAITTIGSTQTTLFVPAGAWVGGGVTVPANVTLSIQEGGYFTVANGTTLTINGSIEAGPYQIVSWTGTGTVVLSGCSNHEFPIEWLGGLSGGTDVASALNMYKTALASTKKVVKLGHGVYYLLTPIVVNTTGQCLSIIGQNFNDSVLWINVGANIAISQGVDEDGGDPGIYVTDLVMKNFTMAGGAAACTTALKLAQCGNSDLDLNFWLGSTDYAAIIGNCDWTKARLYLARGRAWPSAISLAALAEPAKGILLTNGNGASINGNNASNFYINSEAVGVNPGLEVSPIYSGGGASGESMEIEYHAENWTGSPLVLDGKGALTGGTRAWIIFRNCHIETDTGSVGGTIPISNIENVTFEGFETTVDNCEVQLFNTRNITFNNYLFRTGISIAPDCQGTVLGPGVTEGEVKDYSGDTRYINGPSINAAFNMQPIGNVGDDSTNYMYNSQLNRWQTAIMDGIWSPEGDTTYTRETSNVHILPNCAKLVYAGAAVGYNYSSFDSYQIQQFKGKYVTFSTYLQLKDAEVYTYYPIVTIQFACPARVNSTAYKLGEGVTDGSGNYYVCVAVTGDAKSGVAPPTWVTSDGGLTVDNHVTWRCGMCVNNTNQGDHFAQGIGNWYRVMVTTYCPLNAVTANSFVVIAQYPQTGGAAGTLYMAEPALMVGRQAPRSYVPNNPNEVLLPGGVKVTSDSVIPSDGGSNINGKWSCVGDRCKNNGATTALTTGNVQEWGCTVAGINGTSSTWAAVSNVP